jgi:hypothetical protein
MAISIKTRLHPDVHGGGVVTTRHTWNTYPRNLLIAVQTLRETARATAQAYGNDGAGKTWLEIDGVVIDPLDLADIEHGGEGTSRTAEAVSLLADVAGGAYRRRQIAEAEALARGEY